ncbi:hypothetical protein AK830_g52 [Neonectria ditissima]|uniref:Uncharacterized protein n=1 Tax=Neonectria ditissima TaxID=78410 RepID=A0A0P7BQL0_9HYPO|nr:hypothetical protein AK830_g52 [Neonectria ditissima]
MAPPTRTKFDKTDERSKVKLRQLQRFLAHLNSPDAGKIVSGGVGVAEILDMVADSPDVLVKARLIAPLSRPDGKIIVDDEAWPKEWASEIESFADQWNQLVKWSEELSPLGRGEEDDAEASNARATTPEAGPGHDCWGSVVRPVSLGHRSRDRVTPASASDSVAYRPALTTTAGEADGSHGDTNTSAMSHQSSTGGSNATSQPATADPGHTDERVAEFNQMKILLPRGSIYETGSAGWLESTTPNGIRSTSE